MYKKLKYLLFSSAILFLAVGTLPTALAMPPVGPPPPAIYYGTSYSYDGMLIENTLHDTKVNNGIPLAVTAWMLPLPPDFILCHYWGHLRINFANGVSGSILKFGGELCPINIGNNLRVQYRDGTYQTFHNDPNGGIEQFSINPSKEVAYVQLSLNVDFVTIPLGGGIQIQYLCVQE